MQRCFDLAQKGIRSTKNNPMVGALLVFENRIIGEGFHQKYGGAHAEVEAINSVAESDRNLIEKSTLFVSLEPCCTTGKTGACTDLILKSKIKSVYISASDPNPNVNGKGINILKENGVKVHKGLLEKEGKRLIRKFKTNLKARPYKVIKFAQSLDRFIAGKDGPTSISSNETNILVHQWRTQFDGILIGSNTAVIDNPKLNVRHVDGPAPLRIVIDKSLKTPKTHQLWTDELPTVFVADSEDQSKGNKRIARLNFDEPIWPQLDTFLYEMGICSLLIEGGANTINHMTKFGFWDEARVISSTLKLFEGTKAPLIIGKRISHKIIGTDEIDIIFNNMSVNIR